MLLLDEIDNKEFLTKLLQAMYEELPFPKPKHKNGVRSEDSLQKPPLIRCSERRKKQ